MASRVAPPLHRRLAYSAILVVAGVAGALCGIEAVLRVSGYGFSPRFVRRVAPPGDDAHWRENRGFSTPIFGPLLVRRPFPFRVSAPKPAGTVRLVVLGSSAAMGDPEPSFSFGRLLEAQLNHAYPPLRFEVINAAVTAINSHVVRGIAADCAALSPDFLIVYEGHNEVIGPFGPGTVFGPHLRSNAAVQAALWCQGTRFAQVLRSLRRTDLPGDWGGMEMFLDRTLEAGDPRLDVSRRHLGANLGAIAEAGRRIGATTLLCTVASNRRDFPPFASMHRADLPPGAQATFAGLLSAGGRAESVGDPAAAQSAYAAALAIDAGYAELHFRLGRLDLAAGRETIGRERLARAVALDALRFRADPAMNDAIRDTARASPPGTRLVDVEADLAAAAPHGVCGDEFFYEHVHFSFRGAHEVARLLFAAVSRELAARGEIAEHVNPPLTADELRARLGFTAHEQAMIALEILGRLRRPPFAAQTGQPERLQLWERRLAAAKSLLGRPDGAGAIRESYEFALSAAPGDWIVARNAGMAILAGGDASRAAPLLLRAQQWIDDDVDTLLALGRTHRALGDHAAEHRWYSRARELEPRHPALP